MPKIFILADTRRWDETIRIDLNLKTFMRAWTEFNWMRIWYNVGVPMNMVMKLRVP
jgi:hypothetical protein